MPLSVKKRGDKYVVTDGSKVFGRHSTKAKAKDQVQAINISKSKRKKK